MLVDEKSKHWLYRPSSVPKLWIIQAVILVLAVLPEFFVHHHSNFVEQGITIDTAFGFYAWYGFLTCAAMVVGAKILGIFLKRKERYYEDSADGGADG